MISIIAAITINTANPAPQPTIDPAHTIAVFVPDPTTPPTTTIGTGTRHAGLVEAVQGWFSRGKARDRKATEKQQCLNRVQRKAVTEQWDAEKQIEERNKCAPVQPTITIARPA